MFLLPLNFWRLKFLNEKISPFPPRTNGSNKFSQMYTTYIYDLHFNPVLLFGFPEQYHQCYRK